MRTEIGTEDMVSAHPLRTGVLVAKEFGAASLARLGSESIFVSREFALGIESLEVFARKDPLRRTHEWAFGVLALESEFVDPRLLSRNLSEKRRQKRRPGIIHSQRDGT
jgi:hypothetical protein